MSNIINEDDIIKLSIVNRGWIVNNKFKVKNPITHYINQYKNKNKQIKQNQNKFIQNYTKTQYPIKKQHKSSKKTVNPKYYNNQYQYQQNNYQQQNINNIAASLTFTNLKQSLKKFNIKQQINQQTKINESKRKSINLKKYRTQSNYQRMNNKSQISIISEYHKQKQRLKLKQLQKEQQIELKNLQRQIQQKQQQIKNNNNNNSSVIINPYNKYFKPTNCGKYKRQIMYLQPNFRQSLINHRNNNKQINNSTKISKAQLLLQKKSTIYRVINHSYSSIQQINRIRLLDHEGQNVKIKINKEGIDMNNEEDKQQDVTKRDKFRKSQYKRPIQYLTEYTQREQSKIGNKNNKKHMRINSFISEQQQNKQLNNQTNKQNQQEQEQKAHKSTSISLARKVKPNHYVLRNKLKTLYLNQQNYPPNNIKRFMLQKRIKTQSQINQIESIIGVELQTFLYQN